MLQIIKHFVLYALLIISITGNAQQLGFEINLISDYDEKPTEFRLSNDGGFVGLVKKALPTDTGYIYDSYLYKIDITGDTMSIKYEKQDTLFSFYCIDKLQNEPSGFLLTGWGYKIGDDPNYPFTILRRIDESLNLVWEKTFYFNHFHSIYRSASLELVNGNILFACSPHLNSSMFIFKLTAQGDSLKYTSYWGDEAGEVWGLTYNLDSSNIWLHNKWAHYQGTGNQLVSCIVLNDKMEQIDVKYYPSNYDTPFNSMIYNDSTLLTGGSDNIPTPEGSKKKIVAYLFDSSFNVINEVYLTHPDTTSRGAESHAIDFYYPNCIYLGGNHNLQGLTGSQPSWFYISKLNDTLGVEFEKYIGGDDYYWLYSVTAAADGGVLLAGTRQELSQVFTERDGYFLKLDSLGCITGFSENTKIKITEAIVYPNPGSDVINIRSALKGCTFHLYNTWGRQIVVKLMLGRITTINARGFKKGNYYYSVTQSNKTIISGTWIKN